MFIFALLHCQTTVSTSNIITFSATYRIIFHSITRIIIYNEQFYDSLLKRMEKRNDEYHTFNLRFCQRASKLQKYVSVITNSIVSKNNMYPKTWN